MFPNKGLQMYIWLVNMNDVMAYLALMAHYRVIHSFPDFTSLDMTCLASLRHTSELFIQCMYVAVLCFIIVRQMFS